MYSIKALAIVAIFGLTPSILALPQNVSAVATVPPDDISKYTVKFFQDMIQKKPEGSSCLFYTKDLTKEAEAFAKDRNLFTIWDCWDKPFYDRSQDETNPRRNILRKIGNVNTPDAQKYFENMSQAYAAQCSGTATLLTDDPSNVGMTGIWGRVEFETLKKTGNPGGQVDVVEAFKKDGTGGLTFWTRGSSKKLRRGGSISRVAVNETESAKRQIADLPNRWYTPEELADIFSDIDPLW